VSFPIGTYRRTDRPYVCQPHNTTQRVRHGLCVKAAPGEAAQGSVVGDANAVIERCPTRAGLSKGSVVTVAR
jgi:hypothetical protein